MDSGSAPPCASGSSRRTGGGRGRTYRRSAGTGAGIQDGSWSEGRRGPGRPRKAWGDRCRDGSLRRLGGSLLRGLWRCSGARESQEALGRPGNHWGAVADKGARARQSVMLSQAAQRGAGGAETLRKDLVGSPACSCGLHGRLRASMGCPITNLFGHGPQVCPKTSLTDF